MSVLSRSSQRRTSSTAPTARTPAGIPAQPQPAGQRVATRPAARSAEETRSRRHRAALVLVGLVAVLAIAIGAAVAMITSDGDGATTIAPAIPTSVQETEQLRDEAAARRGGMQPGPAADAPAAPAVQGSVFVG